MRRVDDDALRLGSSSLSLSRSPSFLPRSSRRIVTASSSAGRIRHRAARGIYPVCAASYRKEVRSGRWHEWGWKCHRRRKRGSGARGGGGSNERAGRETSTSQRSENGVTLLRPAAPASVSFRPRFRSVALGEGLRVYARSASPRPPLFPAYFRPTEYTLRSRAEPSRSGRRSRCRIMNMG